jgi:hypothetical protein
MRPAYRICEEVRRNLGKGLLLWAVTVVRSEKGRNTMKQANAVKLIALAALVIVAAGGWALGQQETVPPATQPAAPQPAAPPPPAAAPAPAAPTIPVMYMEGARIEFNGKALYAGNVTLELTVHGRDPKVLSVDVIPKMAGDDIAEDLYKSLTLAAGPEFKVKDSGKRVIIGKANKTAPNLSLKVTNLSILGVSVLIEPD